MDGNRPTAAERIRTLVEGNASAVVEIPGADVDELALVPARRTLMDGGDLEFSLPLRIGEEVAAVVEITDVAPVAVPHRVRGRAWVSGWLTDAGTEESGSGMRRLRLETVEATVDDLWGTGRADPEELAAAEPDPLARSEAEILQHLAESHADQVRMLDALVPEAEVASDARAVPVALDRNGLRVRYVTPAGRAFDAVFEFPRPVSCAGDLRSAMSALLRAAAH